MKSVILQPSYIPWRGYFHQIAKADIFVFYDDVQYDKRGWRNRNKIRTAQGTQWLTIPVHSKGAQSQGIPINQIKISWERDWHIEHLKSLQVNYSRAPFFEQFFPEIEKVYLHKEEYLADFTINLTIRISELLGITKTKFVRSSEMGVEGIKTDRLINVLEAIGADHYISGPSAKGYIEPEKFSVRGISLEYMDYNYPDYEQLYQPFEPQVSILDLLFLKGSHALDFIL